MRIKHTIDAPELEKNVEKAKDILDNKWIPVVAMAVIGLFVIRKSSGQPIIINNYPR